MKTIRLRLTNYKGLENYELNPGQITALIGGNGRGKTTIVDAFRSLADGGSEPDSITKGHDEATIKWVLQLDEGDCGGAYPPGRYEVERKIRLDGYSLNVKNPKGVKIPKEKAFVEACLPKMAYDPIAFDKLTDEQRAEALKDILKVPVTTEEIRKAAGLVNLGAIKEAKFDDGIAAIDRFDAGLATSAQELRADIKARDGSIRTFEASLEGKSAEDVKASLNSARIRLSESTKALEEAAHELQSARSAGKAEAIRVATEELSAINDWYNVELAALNKQRDDRKQASDLKMAAAKEAAEANFIAKSDEILNPLRETVSLAKGEIAALEVKAEEAAKLAGAIKQIETWREERISKNDQLERITVAREQLDRLRNKLLAKISLDGMEIKGGRLYIGGVLSSEVNTAARILKWVEVATQYANDGQLIIVDDLEHLSDPNRKVFEDCLRKANIQLLATIVDPEDGPLRVENTLVSA